MSVTLTGDEIKTSNPIKIAETASAVADTSGYGQIWVKNSDPNELHFTTDTGTDIQITTDTGLFLGGGNIKRFELNAVTTSANKTGYINLTATGDYSYIVNIQAIKRDTAAGGANSGYFKVTRGFAQQGGTTAAIFDQTSETAGTLNGTDVTIGVGTDKISILLTKHSSDTSTTWKGVIEVITDDTLTFTDFT